MSEPTQPTGQPTVSSTSDGGGSTSAVKSLPPQLAGHLIGEVKLMPPNRAGEGLLWLGRWKDGRRVVIKMQKFRLTMTKVWTAWRQADHRYVVPLVYAVQVGDQAFEVTEYLPGGSLHQEFRERHQRLPFTHAVVVLNQIASALDYLHTKALRHHPEPDRIWIHGDIKPGNILVRSSGHDPTAWRVCLADFGIARIQQTVGEGAPTQTFTPGYAAPEAVIGESTPALDWWSLGMTMLELIQGRHPFEGHDGRLELPGKINAKINSDHVPMDPAIPERWLLLLRGLLSWNPEHRWSYDQVRLWLGGVDSPVHDRIGVREPVGEPFMFAGRQVTRASELASAMAENWSEAADVVVGRRWDDLLGWAGATSSDLYRRMLDVNPSDETRRPPPDRAIAELISMLDPHRTPTFRGLRIGKKALLAHAKRVESNQRYDDGMELIDSLYDTGSLTALGRLDGCLALRGYDEIWQRWNGGARQTARLALGSVERIPPVGGLTGAQVLTCMLLRAAISSWHRSAIRRAAEKRVTAEMHRVDWFENLLRHTDGPDAPMFHSLIYLTASLAADPVEINEAARRTAEREFNQLRRRLDHAIKAPAVEGRTGVARWTGSRGGSPARNRSRSDRPRPSVRRLTLLATMTGAVGYLTIVTTAGLGVATATTRDQGLLTAAMVGITGVGLLLRPGAGRSRLVNATRGASLGCVGGLALATPAGVASGVTLGAPVGWSAFWFLWAVLIFVGSAFGAAR